MEEKLISSEVPTTGDETLKENEKIVTEVEGGK